MSLLFQNGAMAPLTLVGGAHKWLCGSYESAFLYVRPALLPRLHPAATGWIASADPLSFAPPTAPPFAGADRSHHRARRRGRARDRHAALRFPGDGAVACGLVASGFICSYRGGLRIAPHAVEAVLGQNSIERDHIPASINVGDAAYDPLFPYGFSLTC